MKDLYHLSAKAYQEGYEVLSSLPEDSQKKIPMEIWQFIEEKRDLQYKYKLGDELLEETNLLLAILYKSYLATEEEKKIIQAKEFAVRRRQEIEARKKYNPDDLFNF